MNLAKTVGATRSFKVSAPDLFAIALADRRPMLRARALILTQDQARAEDLVQDTIERALLNRDRFRAGTNLCAWVTAIMRNLFIDERRRSSLRPPAPDVSCAPAIEETMVNPIDLVDDADIRQALHALAPDERDMFDLAYFHDVSYREIARRFHIQVSTVGSRLYRTRAKIRAALQKNWEASWRDSGRTSEAPPLA